MDCKNNNALIILAHNQMVNYLINIIPKSFKARKCQADLANRPEGRNPDIEFTLEDNSLAYLDIGISQDMERYYDSK